MNSFKRSAPGTAWRLTGTNGQVGDDLALIWDSHDLGMRVLSSVHSVPKNERARNVIVVPHFHVSATFQASRPPRTCTDQEMEVVRRDFSMGGAEEDNHGPGIARHLWLACDEDRTPDCPCKADEDKIVEGARVRYEETTDA